MPNGGEIDYEALKSLPSGVALSWGIVKQPRRGPKGELSIPQIVEAAVAIADQDGLAAVSMSRVAQSLGFTTMSLYRYMTSKDDLLLLMQEAVSGIVVPPEGAFADWREEMREYVRATVRIFREHPWFLEIPIQSVPLTPNSLRIVDWVLRIMRDFPIRNDEKIGLLFLISSYARAWGIIQRDMDRVIRAGGGMEAFSGANAAAALKLLATPESYPNLYPMLGIYMGEAEVPEEQGDDLDFGLDRIMDGIEHYIQLKCDKQP